MPDHMGNGPAGADTADGSGFTAPRSPAAPLPTAQDRVERSWDAWTRQRTCFHEAGHALAAVLTTGKPPTLVSTRPGEWFNGVTVIDPADLQIITD